MRIMIKGREVRVPSKLGHALIKAGRARSLQYEMRVTVPEPISEIEEKEEKEVEEISPRTGKPKRRYRRRDMQAETSED